MTKPLVVPFWATNIPSDILTSLNVNNITFLGFQPLFNLPVTRYSFSASPDLSTVLPGHSLNVSGATNNDNNGQFLITNVNTSSFYVDVINASRLNSNFDETSSPASADITTLSPEIQEPSDAKKGQGFIAGEKAGASHFNWLFYWIAQWINWIDISFTGVITDYNTIANLKTFDTTNLETGNLAYIKELDSIYRFDKTSTINEDFEYYISPTTGGGSWVLFLPSMDYISIALSDIKSYFQIKINKIENEKTDLKTELEILKQKHQDLEDILRNNGVI